MIMRMLVTWILFLHHLMEGMAKALLPFTFFERKPLFRETVLITDAGQLSAYHYLTFYINAIGVAISLCIQLLIAIINFKSN